MKKSKEDKICELKGRCFVVFPDITVMRRGNMYYVRYHLGDMELAEFPTPEPDEVAKILKVIEAVEDGYRKHNINTIYIAPEGKVSGR